MRNVTRAKSGAISIALALALIAGPAASGIAQPDPNEDHTIAPAEVTAAAEAALAVATEAKAAPPAALDAEDVRAACDLLPEGSQSEFASCLRVEASLDRAPQVGETAKLTVRIESTEAFDDADVVIDVPEGLEIVEGPGTNSARQRSPRGDGRIRQRSASSELRRDGVKTLTFRVRAVAAGEAPIEVRVSGPLNEAYTEGAMDIIPLTVGEDGESSAFAIDESTEGGVETALEADGFAPADADSTDADVAAPLDGPETINDDEASAELEGAQQSLATSCISGRWGYAHPTNGYTGVPNYQVQVWDEDTLSADDLLVQGVTNSTGNYNLCYNETDGEGSAAQEVYVRFIASNTVWRVRDTAAGNNNYANATGVVSVADGANHSFGNLQPGNNVHRAVRAFHAIDRFWKWGKDPAGNCFDWGETSCRQMVINWTPTSTDGTYYSGSGNDIHLAAADPDSDHTTIHEGAHAVMDDVYNDNYPSTPNCNPHTIQGTSSQGCAWSEGFAEWVPASVLNDPFYRWANGASLNLETPTWGTATWNTGDNVEGRVAGAMIDISDNAKAASDWWETWTESQAAQWQTFQRWNTLGNGARPGTYAEYWTDRAQDGKNTTDEGANSGNFQNTIDYSYRNTLTSLAQETYPSPQPTQHRYRISNSAAQNGAYWSAVAIRGAGDYDLRYYEDLAQTQLLGSSAASGAVIDFIAADHNHRATNLDYPRVDYWSGTGNYNIEWAATKQSIGNGSSVMTFAAGDVVQVRDSSHSTGTPVYYRAVPATGLDVEMFLMDSDPAAAATHVAGRASAVRSASATGLGGEESFNLSTASDWLGFVVLNKAGSGSVTIYRDTTAPTGTVSINNGAADTSSTAVTLNLNASDAQTGIRNIRISTDGVFDSETWQSYSATKAVTLPAGDGTKTVQVQFRNQANMVTTASDTIRLYTGVRCAGRIPTIFGTNGDDVINGTAGSDVIVGLGGNDTINGRDGNDLICGGGGNDTISGGNGNDTIYGEGGVDTINGNAGNDTMYGGNGNDMMRGGAGNDTMYGEANADTLYGDAGDDRIDGGAGSPDVCHGGAGTKDVHLGGCEQIFTVP